jgi:ryanodine receptor 2
MNKIEEGWVFGERRDDLHKIHPCLTPFDRLPPAEKRYDTQLALQTLKSITYVLTLTIYFTKSFLWTI